MADRINNLGNYADLAAVWEQHPEGGRDGDYVKIGAVEHYWSDVDRQWVALSSATHGGASQTVEGDMNVGGNLNVGGDAHVAGTLTVDDIQVGNGQQFKGQSTCTAFVFCRRTTKPSSPIGGSYNDPQPDGVLWHDGVPQGEAPIWMSKRIFTSDGLSPQGDWSDPVLMKDDESTDIEFSPYSADAVPPEPTAANRGAVWFDPTVHTYADWTSMVWMAIATKGIDGDGNVVYGPWTISLIKGERGADGDGYEIVFYRTKLKVAPVPVSSQTDFQNTDYCPSVSNKNDCQGDGDAFTDNPKGVDKDWRYEWAIKRKKRNGVWLSFSSPVLWASYSRDYYIGENGNWWVDGEDTERPAVATDGAVATIAGRVDVYSDDEAESGQRSLQSYPSTQGVDVGDCWVVANGEDGDDQDVSGHLFLYVGGDNDNWERNWEDLGEFKGEKGDPGDNGHSQYLYLAWAADVQFNDGSPQTFRSVTGFTTDPAVGQTYGWMGIKVSDTEISGMDSSANANLYKWNYLAGRDGIDYEHVYIRTSIPTPPVINANVTSYNRYQQPEFCPPVDNYGAYTYREGSANNTIESLTFTDDPGGISARWPYEWQARRDKVNGVWQMFTQPILHRNWAAQGQKGDDGAGQAYIVSDIDQIVVDCDSDGRPTAAVEQAFSASLRWGDDDCNLLTSRCSITEDTVGSIDKTYPLESGERKVAAIVYRIITAGIAQFPVLASGRITISLVGEDSDGNEHTAVKTIAVIANKQGLPGEDGQPGAAGVSGPCLRFRGEYSSTVDQSGAGYVWNDTFRDCVKGSDGYYLVNTRTSGSTPLGTPTTLNDKWVNGGDMKFFATELLLAENGIIQLLSTNKLIFLNANGHKTAGINEDGQGSYKTYYPDTGNLRKDDNADGWTYYYNNDEANTMAWKLGPGGDIIKITNSYWNTIMLALVSSTRPTGNTFTGSSRYTLAAHPQYMAGVSGMQAYNKKIFSAGTVASGSPVGKTAIADGYYTDMGQPIADVSSIESEAWELKIYHIVGGFVTEEFFIYSDAG